MTLLLKEFFKIDHRFRVWNVKTLQFNIKRKKKRSQKTQFLQSLGLTVKYFILTCSFVLFIHVRKYTLHRRTWSPSVFVEMSPRSPVPEWPKLPGPGPHQWLVFGVMDLSEPADRHNIYKSGPLLPTNFCTDGIQICLAFTTNDQSQQHNPSRGAERDFKDIPFSSKFLKKCFLSSLSHLISNLWFSPPRWDR